MENSYESFIDFRQQKEWSAAPMWLEMSFGAWGGGLFIFGTLLNQFSAMLIGFLLLIVGKGLFLLADLGNPFSFFKVFSRPFQSWISFGSWAFSLFGIFGLALLFTSFLDIAPTSALPVILKIAALICALILIAYDGFFLSASSGIEAWKSGLLPVMFAVNALVSGSGAALFISALQNIINPSLLMTNTLLLIIELVMIYSYYHSLKQGTIGAKKSANLLAGEMKLSFFIGKLTIATLLPLIILLFCLLQGNFAAAWIAAVVLMELIGVVLLRYCVLKAGVYTPIM